MVRFFDHELEDREAGFQSFSQYLIVISHYRGLIDIQGKAEIDIAARTDFSAHIKWSHPFFFTTQAYCENVTQFLLKAGLQCPLQCFLGIGFAL